MTPCEACGAEPIANTGLCFDCGRDVSPAQRHSRRLQVDLPATGQRRLVEALAVLTGRAVDDIERVFGLGRIELVANATAQQVDGLLALFSAAGAEAHVSDRFVAGESYGASFSWDPVATAKALCVAALGAAGWFLEVPWVMAGALGVGTLIAVRAWQLVSPELVASPPLLDRHLGAFPLHLAQEALATRKRISNPATVAAARQCLVALAGLLGAVRADGGHLVDRDLHRLESQLVRVVRTVLRLALVADALPPAAARATAGAASSPPDPAPDVVAQLRQMARELDGMRPPLVRARAAGATRQALTEALQGLAAIEAELEPILHGAPPAPA